MSIRLGHVLVSLVNNRKKMSDRIAEIEEISKIKGVQKFKKEKKSKLDKYQISNK